jgi:hypothetical protein
MCKGQNAMLEPKVQSAQKSKCDTQGQHANNQSMIGVSQLEHKKEF